MTDDLWLVLKRLSTVWFTGVDRNGIFFLQRSLVGIFFTQHTVGIDTPMCLIILEIFAKQEKLIIIGNNDMNHLKYDIFI